MNRRFLSGLGIAATALFAAACGDLPTLPSIAETSLAAPASLARGQARNDAFLGGVQVRCVLGRASKSGSVGWESRRMNFGIPGSAGVSNSRTLRYRYAMVSRAGRVLRVAECDVPATGAAVRRLDAMFGANGPGTKRRGADGSVNGDMQTQGCVGDGECELDGLVVTVPENDGCPYVYTGGCEDPFGGPVGGTPPDVSGGGGNGGGSGWGAGISSYGEGPLVWAGCVLAVTGSGVSIWIVAQRFEDWYGAHKQRTEAERMLQAVRENNPTPEMLQLYQYMLRQAVSAEAAAVKAVSENTGLSVIALLFAGAACGASLFLPTP